MNEIIETIPINKGAWAIVKEAVAGSHRDFTQGALGTAIFLLAVPMILEMVMESVFAVVDIFFVAKLGAEAVAVVGITESMMAIIYAMAMGLGIGATATVARRIGEKDSDGAAISAVHVIYLGLIVSSVLGIAGAILAPDFLHLMGASEAAIIKGGNYTRIMLGGNAVVIFLFLLNAIFRGAGDAAIAMRVLWLANIFNIILAPCFIFGIWFFPELGVTGAAVGTTIGRGLGVLFAVSQLFRRDARLTIHARHLRVIPEMLWKLVKLSSAGTLQMVIGTASWIGLVKIVAGFGSEAVAGYTIGIRVIVFALLPSLGLSNAAATLVGQCLGAGKPERAEQAVWRAAFYNAIFLTTISLLFIAFAPLIISIFTNEPIVLRYGADGLRIVASGFLFYAYGMVLETSFNGAGDTLTPTYINLFIFWLFEIPLAYILAYNFELGLYGVFWAITIAFSMLAVVAAVLFRRGTWKTRIV
ncbi:MAG: MATE family efflux transporter [Pyrinomonadaceae bacterium]